MIVKINGQYYRIEVPPGEFIRVHPLRRSEDKQTTVTMSVRFFITLTILGIFGLVYILRLII